MADFNRSSLIQGSLAQMHDMHGSFIPYYNPCCGICKKNHPCGKTNCGHKGCCSGGVVAPVSVYPGGAPLYAAPLGTAAPGAAPGPAPGVSSLKMGQGYAQTQPVGNFVIPGYSTSNPAAFTTSVGNNVSGGNITIQPGATAPNTVLPPGTSENLILCELLATSVNPNHYLTYNGGDPVYSIPNQTLLPQAYEDAFNGFAPCTFDEHLYDGACGSCKGEKGGCDKCKYKTGKFLIQLEAARTASELSISPFALSANGIRERIIYVTRGERYEFFFQPCCLVVGGPDAPEENQGLPYFKSGVGAVKIKCDDVPPTFQGVSIIFTTDRSVRTDDTRLPLENTNPIPLFGAQWLYIGPQVPPYFLIAAIQETDPAPLNASPGNLTSATILVIVTNPTTSRFPFPT